MNRFLSRDTLIPFAEMTPAEVEPAIDEALKRAETDLEALLQTPERTFATIRSIGGFTTSTTQCIHGRTTKAK